MRKSSTQGEISMAGDECNALESWRIARIARPFSLDTLIVPTLSA
jgi:hypothetical protein